VCIPTSKTNATIVQGFVPRESPILLSPKRSRARSQQHPHQILSLLACNRGTYCNPYCNRASTG